MMFAAALLMSSCGLYSKYERPDVNTDGVIRQWTDGADSLLVNDTTSFGNLPWRQVFTDPLLQALIQQGLDHNVNMLNAALNVKMVEEQLKVAKLAFVPQFTFTPQASISSWDFGKATQTYSLPINASWSIDLFGNLLNLTAYQRLVEHRPLRQPAQPETLNTDGAPRHERLSGGGENTAGV